MQRLVARLTAAALLAALLIWAVVPDVAASTDLALGKPCTSTSDSGASYDCPKAFDGDDSTRWAVASGAFSGQHIAVDLGSAQQVLSFRALGLAGSSGCPTGTCWAAHYKLQFCDTSLGGTTCNGADPGWTDATGDIDGVGTLDYSAAITPTTAEWWRLLQQSAAYGLWTIKTFALFGPVSSAHMTASDGRARAGATGTVNLQSVDGAGVDVTAGTTFTLAGVIGVLPLGVAGMTCAGLSSFPALMPSSTPLCGSVNPGTYILNWHDGAGNTASSFFVVVDATARFRLISECDSRGVVPGEFCRIFNYSLSPNGSNVSRDDSWTVSSISGSDVTCGTPYPTGEFFVTQCVGGGSSTGTHTITGTDSFGFTSSATMIVTGAAVASTACGATDLGCYLTRVWNAVKALGDIPRQIANFLFVSASGRSYLDLANVQVIPYVTCRGGEVASAPDGVHCYPFPFAVPGQFAAMFTVLLVAPVTPVIDWHIQQSFVDVHVPIDPSVLLTATIMGWVRGVEYVLFVTGLGMAVNKYVQMFGVA